MRAAAAAEVVQEAGRPEHSMAIFWSSCGECTLIGLARIVALAGDISATEMISSGLHAWCTGTAARRRAWDALATLTCTLHASYVHACMESQTRGLYKSAMAHVHLWWIAGSWQILEPK